MAHEIRVEWRSQLVGTLSLEGGRLRYRYSPQWLAQPGAAVLSQSLPLQPTPFDDHQCRPFFAGLLPEGHLRRLIAMQCQVSSQNDFALLNAIGGECAGAITFVSAGQAAAAVPSGVQWLDDSQLIAMLEELPRRPMLAGQDGMRLSLAGAQDKLPVVVSQATGQAPRIGLPLGAQPSTHILKPAIATVDDSVINEGFCMALAHAAGMTTAQTEIFSIQSRPVLLVSRYDRHTDASDNLIRIHQEDFCQALGVVPEMKYQNEGGPDLRACFELLRRTTRPSSPQVLRLLDAVIFNALIGNHDAHGKNFSLVYKTSQSPTLAPLYDLLSTAIYEHLTPKMAMKLGGKYKWTEVHGQHWAQFAQEAGLSPAQTQKRVLGMAQKLPHLAKRLQTLPLFVHQPIAARIVALIEHRCALTASRIHTG